ncbi:MAG: class I SAM-dependent methyltransferase [Candidatus Poribacteria bacterium]|nr:class I SAM-dependent methyltransferase [Candidatus Poribacteria bacterium]
MTNDRSGELSDAFTSSVADAYDHYYQGVPGDIRFYVEEALKAGSPVLEIGCGTGRVAIPLAEAGIEVVGLDREERITEIARRKLALCSDETQRRVSFVNGDMRDFDLKRIFPTVIVAYNTFLHLMTPDDQSRALSRIHAHLEVGGRLILNVLDPRPDVLATRDGKLEQARGFVRPDGLGGASNAVRVSVCSRTDAERQTLSQDVIFEELDAVGRVKSKSYRSFVIRYVYRYEMEHLLRLRGFEIDALYGDFFRNPHGRGTEQVWVARKVASG